MKFRQAMGRAEQVHAAQAVDHQHRHDGAGQHTREVDNKPWCGPPAAEHQRAKTVSARRHARDHRHKQRTVYIKRHGRPPFFSVTLRSSVKTAVMPSMEDQKLLLPKIKRQTSETPSPTSAGV